MLVDSYRAGQEHHPLQLELTGMLQAQLPLQAFTVAVVAEVKDLSEVNVV